MSEGRGGWGLGAVFASAWMLCFFLVAPTLIVFPVSVTDQRYLSLPKHGISFQHYANIVANEFWWSSIVQSVFVASISTAITVVLGTMVTVGCWRLSTRTSELVRALMLLPMIVPSVIHALGFFRMWIDLDLLDTFVGVIATHVITSLPYVVITVSTALANFDVRLEQAARNLGASLGQTMRLVIVPCILPGVVTGGIFAFVHAWDELVVVLFITSRKVYLLPRAIWDGINENVDPTIAAIATLLIAVTLVGVLIERIAKLRVAPKAEDDAAAAASLRPGAVAVASD